MPRSKKIDTTLQERYGILHQLERLKQENITLDEMEQIGTRLMKSGKRALRPLVRRLWRERNGDLISKYTYLLDFFEDEVWLDQLIQIALKRRDLDKEGKAAIMAALEGYGVDVNLPPFSTLFAGIGNPFNLSLPEVLERGEGGIISFLDEFLQYPQDVQLLVIRELPAIDDPRVVSLLEVVLWLENREVVAEALTALGKIRDTSAAAALKRYRPSADVSLHKLACRSLRRLSFLGVETDSAVSSTLPLAFHECYASPLDGDGHRSLVFSRWADSRKIIALYLQVHDARGVIAAWGCGGITPEEFIEELTEIRGEEGVVAVSPDYALLLLRDAIHLSRESNSELPADFYVRRSMFLDNEVMPASYSPDLDGYVPKRLLHSAGRVEAFDTIFDDDFFSCWFMVNGTVYDFAEEWSALERSCSGKQLTHGLESILERFCRLLLMPEIERIKKRLFLTADLMRHVGRERALVEKTVALAHSLDKNELPYHFHPFLRRFALESMDMAREALSEGYDLRRQVADAEEDDWE